MEITGQTLKDAFKKDPAKLSHVLAEAIRDFGYPVTDVEIQAICQQVIEGKASDSDPVAMMINNWLTNGM